MVRKSTIQTSVTAVSVSCRWRFLVSKFSQTRMHYLRGNRPSPTRSEEVCYRMTLSLLEFEGRSGMADQRTYKMG
ncbi:hypothetical protein M405DRAFT_417666 [Rhizopogon salebrosus TDB-379]|nr:hypothetical protein M405DRAFT_417666 [Rhizopogon salebrosus TDB-379]